MEVEKQSFRFFWGVGGLEGFDLAKSVICRMALIPGQETGEG